MSVRFIPSTCSLSTPQDGMLGHYKEIATRYLASSHQGGTLPVNQFRKRQKTRIVVGVSERYDKKGSASKWNLAIYKDIYDIVIFEAKTKMWIQSAS